MFFSDEGKLQNVLQFMSGLTGLPPLGMNPQLTLSFSHREDCEEMLRDLPYANTCSNNLTVPVMRDYGRFRNIMRTAVIDIGCLFTNE